MSITVRKGNGSFLPNGSWFLSNRAFADRTARIATLEFEDANVRENAIGILQIMGRGMR